MGYPVCICFPISQSKGNYKEEAQIGFSNLLSRVYHILDLSLQQNCVRYNFDTRLNIDTNFHLFNKEMIN